MRDITSIVNDINCGLLPKLDAVGKILAKLNNDMDPIVIRLLFCVKCMIEALPSDSQKKAVLEFQQDTCNHYFKRFFFLIKMTYCSSG